MTDRSVIIVASMTLPLSHGHFFTTSLFVLAEIMVRRRNETLPSELTAAALTLFVEKGFAATRLDDVAARAGVSKGTVYLYFKSKEDLFKAVIRESILPVLEECEAVVAGHQGNSRSLLKMLLDGWWRQIGGTELAGVPKLMISEARNFPEVARFYHQNAILRGRQLIVGVLERGIAAGEFRPVDVNLAFDIIIAPLLMRAIWRFSMGACCGQAAETFGAGEPDNAQPYLDLHFDLLVSGLLKETS